VKVVIFLAQDHFPSWYYCPKLSGPDAPLGKGSVSEKMRKFWTQKKIRLSP